MPYLLANSVTTSVPMHSGICSPTPEQALQNNLNSWESFWDTVLLEEVSSVAERPWTEWQDYHTILVWWDGKTRVIVFCGHNLCDKLNSVADLPRSSESRAAPGQGMGEELRVTPVSAVPSLMHPTASAPMGRAWCWSQGPSAVLDAAKG